MQRDAAEEAVRNLWGVKSVDNSIQLSTYIKADDVKSKIQEAFQRHAALDAKKVRVDVEDGTITLSGSVSSWGERRDAEGAAWRAPGVTHVHVGRARKARLRIKVAGRTCRSDSHARRASP
ncbi:MAG: BON domain-containing protein [Steroidobacteraceae bacterium]